MAAGLWGFLSKVCTCIQQCTDVASLVHGSFFLTVHCELDSNVYFVSEIPKWALYGELIQGNPMACALLEATWSQLLLLSCSLCMDDVSESTNKREIWLNNSKVQDLAVFPQNNLTHSIWSLSEWCRRECKVYGIWPSCCSFFFFSVKWMNYTYEFHLTLSFLSSLKSFW